METKTNVATEYLDRVLRRITGDLEGDDLLRVLWLSSTLFFVVGGYWLLRTLKDPIMSVIDGVEYIPQAKIASLFVVFGLVIIYNKLLDMFPKHQVFYMMGIFYGVLFTLIGLLLMHPTIGLSNTNSNPSRFLGWLSYVSIESFGSMVVQCFWALVNSSVNVEFAKKNFGFIVAGMIRTIKHELCFPVPYKYFHSVFLIYQERKLVVCLDLVLLLRQKLSVFHFCTCSDLL